MAPGHPEPTGTLGMALRVAVTAVPRRPALPGPQGEPATSPRTLGCFSGKHGDGHLGFGCHSL